MFNKPVQFLHQSLFMWLWFQKRYPMKPAPYLHQQWQCMCISACTIETNGKKKKKKHITLVIFATLNLWCFPFLQRGNLLCYTLPNMKCFDDFVDLLLISNLKPCGVFANFPFFETLDILFNFSSAEIIASLPHKVFATSIDQFWHEWRNHFPTCHFQWQCSWHLSVCLFGKCV